VGRTGYGEATPPAPVEQNVQVLAGLEQQRLYRRQAQKNLQDIGSQRCKSRDATRERLDVDFGNACDQPCLNNEIRPSAGLAEKDVARLRFLSSESNRDTVRVFDLTRPQARAARGAMTRLAAMRQIEARRERSFEYRAIRSYSDKPSVWLNDDFVLRRSHTSD
jgi:hypothetical protein